MKILNPGIIIKREYENCCNSKFYKAYWRGTLNRIMTLSGGMCPARTNKADLLFDLKNNPMEYAVMIEC